MRLVAEADRRSARARRDDARQSAQPRDERRRALGLHAVRRRRRAVRSSMHSTPHTRRPAASTSTASTRPSWRTCRRCACTWVTEGVWCRSRTARERSLPSIRAHSPCVRRRRPRSWRVPTMLAAAVGVLLTVLLLAPASASASTGSSPGRLATARGLMWISRTSSFHIKPLAVVDGAAPALRLAAALLLVEATFLRRFRGLRRPTGPLHLRRLAELLQDPLGCEPSVSKL